MMGAIREVLGYGTFLGFPLLGSNYEPWIIFILPPGGFFTIGFILLALNWWERRKLERARAGEPLRGAAVERAA
jgi:electron transport complex protein RnfE